MMRIVGLFLLAILLSSCGTRQIGTVRPAPHLGAVTDDPQIDSSCQSGKTVWVTIDGTGNTPVSRTGAARLHEIVEVYSYRSHDVAENSPRPGHTLANWYAEGVGADDNPLGGGLGVGVNTDIKKAFAFLTANWRPCDTLFFNGFSRGAYTVRALGGLLYMAGIPDFRQLDSRSRDAAVDELFDAYKTGKAGMKAEEVAKQRIRRIANAYKKIRERHGFDPVANRARLGKYSYPESRVIIKAMTIWDSVQALGMPDKIEDPNEGPPYFLTTACNVERIFHPLSLDDNRVYSFTVVMAGGSKATELCPDGTVRQNANEAIKEVWFSGAHADVGGTYDAADMLDGELSSISLNWMLARLTDDDCPGCRAALSLPKNIQVPASKFSAIHDGKRSNVFYKGLYRQTRKPMVYWYHVYGKDKPMVVHPSVFDRIEWLFAYDFITPGCRGTKPTGDAVLCAKDIASNGLVPELFKGNGDGPCMEASDWGYKLIEGQKCVALVSEQTHEAPPSLPKCKDEGEDRYLENALVFTGKLEDTNPKVVNRDEPESRIPYPACMRDYRDYPKSSL